MHRRRRYQRNGCCTVRINPVLAFIQRFIPYALDGLLLGYIFRGVRKSLNTSIACFVTGFFSLPEYVILHDTARRALRQYGIHAEPDGRKECHRLLLRLVGINAVCEMISSTVITGAVGLALYKAHFVPVAATRTKTIA